MKRLVDVAHDRSNNFHLLRLLAATAVLFSHSFPLATGDISIEPLRRLIGCTPGSIAVDLFFLVSGLLVTISLVKRNSAADFARARFFRIWPALTVALLISVLVLGPAFTTLPIVDYLASFRTWRYLGQNLVLLHGIIYRLPGVFLHNPAPEAVNGSLWTLPSEIRCYLWLLAGWWVLRRLGGAAYFKYLVGAVWLALFAWHVHSLANVTLENSPARMYLMFCTGAALYLFRSAVTLSSRWLAVGLVAVVLAAVTGSGLLFGLAYTVVIPYAMLCAAYLPSGWVLKFNRFGDYSYGTYIFAYPVQQSLMASLPSLGIAGLFFASLGITTVLAVASWHFIEKPAMRLARRTEPASSPIARPAKAA